MTMAFTSDPALVASLGEAVGGDETRVRAGASLAPLTTFHVGGPADYLVETRSESETVTCVRLARAHGLPITVLGGGSNVLVSDAGVRGVVLLVRDRHVARDAEDTVRAGAGLTINGLVRWTVGQGLAGLEAWAGTPGTVGGAVHGNAHFQGRNIGDLIRSVRLVSPDGVIADVAQPDMGFAYDTSRLQRSREIALSALFKVGHGSPDVLRAIARSSLAFRKRTQPLDVPSAGCIFQNPDPARDCVPDGIPASAGALVDRAGLKGQQVGGARVSPVHGNFIVHDGTASASDVRALVERCKHEVAERFGVRLREEIVYLGAFTSES
jgi:UDP-N-acetylmuramate dehydrogenase